MVEQIPSIVDNPLSSFVTADDVILLLATLITIVSLAWLIGRLITFIPSFMVDTVKKVKNKSIIDSNETLHDTSLDKSEIGLKTFVEKVFK